MEVHHPHHPTHKKKWSEYIIEFVMLFTAVTLGFFAENIREHFVEVEKKKHLLEIVSLDFQRDLNQLVFLEQYAKEKISSCNQLLNFFEKDPKSVNQKDYYADITKIKGWWFFNSEEKSRIEAESKGYLYLKENSELVYTILRFNFFKNDYTNTEQFESKLIDKFNYEIPYFSDFKLYSTINRHPEPILKNNFGIPIMKKDEIEKTKFLLSEFMFNNDVYLSDIDSMKLYANKAISIIKKQYE